MDETEKFMEQYETLIAAVVALRFQVDALVFALKPVPHFNEALRDVQSKMLADDRYIQSLAKLLDLDRDAVRKYLEACVGR